MSDPNWLLSSAAQSAAAIVGIVGGFFVSRLLALSAERNSIIARLDEVERMRSLSARRLDELQAWFTAVHAWDFIVDCANDLVQSEGSVSLAKLLETHDSRRLSGEDLAPYYKLAVDVVRNAYELFTTRYSVNSSFPWSLDGFLEHTKLKLPQIDEVPIKLLYLKVYNLIRKRQHGTGLHFFPEIEMEEMSLLSQSPDQALYHGKRLQRDALRAELLQLEAQKTGLEAMLRGFRLPSGLWSGLLVLMFFSITGIIIPLAFMPADPNNFPVWKWWVVFGGFLGGLLTVVAYLVYSVKELTRPQDGPTN